ncbi:hypothetical protein ID866_4784 [Astraeus odoratus]|nr:hypothetical protein ID866_4784 [Astraeus odoratus]
MDFEQFDFKTVLGPIAIGNTISAILLGSAIVQANTYYQQFKADSWLLKAFVSASHTF